ncbi:MAG: hypothetical protein JWP45_2897, partial [Mucilaginibacter sp.]|nr:hypothetical protein [Mucilaginibacter sp.]
ANGRSFYEYQTQAPGIPAQDGIAAGGGVIDHSGYLDNANQGGGATVYVEKDGLGHAYIEVNGTVFSFGRYAGTSSPHAHLGDLSPVGPGVLLKETHQFAVDRMKQFPTNVYNFPDANSDAIYTYLNNLYNNGSPIQTAKEGWGRNIGTYTLWGNNCTTMTTTALQMGGVPIPTIVSPSGFIQYENAPMLWNLPVH